MEHRHLKVDFSHYVVQAIDQQDGLMAVQDVALIRTSHVAAERISALGDISDTETSTHRIESVKTRDDILEEGQAPRPGRDSRRQKVRTHSMG